MTEKEMYLVGVALRVVTTNPETHGPTILSTLKALEVVLRRNDERFDPTLLRRTAFGTACIQDISRFLYVKDTYTVVPQPTTPTNNQQPTTNQRNIV